MPKVIKLVCKLICIGFGIFLVCFNYLYFSADLLSKESQISLTSSPDALKKATQAIKYFPYEPRYYLNRARLYILTYGDTQDTAYKTLALIDLRKAYLINPRNLVTLRNSVPLYYFLVFKDLNMGYAPTNVDLFYENLFRDYVLGLKQTYAHDAGVLVFVADYEKKLHLEDDYFETKSMVKRLRPDLVEWRLID